MRSAGPIATLVSACFSLCILLTSQPAAAQGEYEHCVFHTWAAGSRLGWAEALARHGSSNEDATLIEHVRMAGLHVERAHALCAQNPPPWPAWPNWSQIQGQFSQLVDRFRSGAMTREQLAQAIRSSQQSLASQLAYRALGGQIERAPTCAEHYVRIGADLAFAQTSGQSLRRLPPDATGRLGEARSLISAMRNFRPPCHDFTSLLPGIDRALRDPSDARVVQLLDDTWSRGGHIAAPPGAVADPQQQNSPTAGLVVNGEYVDCVFHTWATGSQLGWAEALARHGSPSEDARMLEHMRVAGLHVERAHALCAQNPPPWPAWQNWRAIQSQIAQLSDQFRRGLMTSRATRDCLGRATPVAGVAACISRAWHSDRAGPDVRRALCPDRRRVGICPYHDANRRSLDAGRGRAPATGTVADPGDARAASALPRFHRSPDTDR